MKIALSEQQVASAPALFTKLASGMAERVRPDSAGLHVAYVSIDLEIAVAYIDRVYGGLGLSGRLQPKVRVAACLPRLE